MAARASRTSAQKSRGVQESKGPKVQGSKGPAGFAPKTWTFGIPLAAALLVVAAIWAYSSSFNGALIGDDEQGIEKNESLRSLTSAFAPPADTTVAGRPVANLSFAMNYAAAGGTTDLWGYHAVNLAIHIGAGLLMFGVIRRTLLSPALRDRFGQAATPLALAVALIWIVHPLNTQAVTFVVQRVESLMGLFYLATLYCAIRAAETDFGRSGWIWAAAAASALGMGAKETMVGAPIVVALWIFVCWPAVRFTRGGRALRLLVPLAATWIVLIALVMTASRSRSAGFDAHGWSSFMYLRTQAEVIGHYVRLACWPVPLVFSYGWLPIRSFADVLPQIMLLGTAAVGTVLLLVNRDPLGLIGAWFFLILAPSSSILPVATEVAAEHRMYLPLAAIVAAVVLGSYSVVASEIRARKAGASSRTIAGAVGWTAVAFVVILLARATYARNAVYESPERMAVDVLQHRPQNAQAQLSYGLYLIGKRQYSEAADHLRTTLTLPLAPSTDEPTFRSLGHLYLGLAQFSQNKFEAAIPELQSAITLRADNDRAYGPLAESQLALGRTADAVTTLEAAIARSANDAGMLKRAAWVLATSSNAAVRNGARAVELANRAVAATNSRDPIALDTLAAAYAETGRFDDAGAAVRRALDLMPPGDAAGPAQMFHAHIAMFAAQQPVRSRDW